MSRVSDLMEPLRVGYEASPYPGAPIVRVSHYEGRPGVLCGLETGLRPQRETDLDCPDWVRTEPVCAACLKQAVHLLRWWYPRATLPAWTLEATP